MFGVISEEGCCDRGEIDLNYPLGKERLYDRTLKALVLADMSLSQHSQATFPRQ
jgi:hypothetical protein